MDVAISLAHDYGMNLILWVLQVTVLANLHVSLSLHTLRFLERHPPSIFSRPECHCSQPQALSFIRRSEG